MTKLSWGKPKIEVVKNTDGAIPAVPVWIVFPEIDKDTAKLTPTAGNKQEAIGEGDEVVDVRYGKTKHSFECDVFVQKGATRPIEDVDGVIADNYAVRLTPEDDTLEGFVIDNSVVACSESWTSAKGKMLKYTFDALKPATGKYVKPYTKAVV